MSNESDDMKFEQMLKSVTPTEVRIDPVAAAFAAGRGSARRQLHVWRCVAGVMLLIGVGGVVVNVQRHPGVASSPLMTVASGDIAAGPISSQSLIMLQRSVHEKGVEGLPTAYIPAAKTLRSSDSL